MGGSVLQSNARSHTFHFRVQRSSSKPSNLLGVVLLILFPVYAGVATRILCKNTLPATARVPLERDRFCRYWIKSSLSDN